MKNWNVTLVEDDWHFRVQTYDRELQRQRSENLQHR
jgi:hypothetical protein